MRHFDILNPNLDSTRQMFNELENDLRSSKIDLGIGVYRDERGEAPVFKAVKKAEKILYQNENSKSYKSPSGNKKYCENILELVLGKKIINDRNGKIGSIQIPGAGSGLRIAGELIKSKTKNKTISVPNPTWGQQIFMFQKTKTKCQISTNNSKTMSDKQTQTRKIYNKRQTTRKKCLGR